MEWVKTSVGRGNLIEGVKGKIYKIIVKPDEMYGMEIVALTKRLDVELELAELLPG